jgi:hypothetical protein
VLTRPRGKLKEGGHIVFNTLDKTWSLAAGLVETVDTPDTTDTDTAADGEESGGITGITVSHDSCGTESVILDWPAVGATHEVEMKLIGWPYAGTVGCLPMPPVA